MEALEEAYTLGDVLGSGSFAQVRIATSRADGSSWAAKIVDKARLS